MRTAGRNTKGPLSRDQVTGFYDKVMYSKVAEEFNGGTYFQNYGYWTAATEDYPEAAAEPDEQPARPSPGDRGGARRRLRSGRDYPVPGGGLRRLGM